MSNRLIFKNFLQKEKMGMEEIQEEDGGVFFRTRQSFKNSGSALIAVCFNKGDSIVDLQVLSFATIDNPLKMELVHDLINELNLNYRFGKFVEEEGGISIQYPIALSTDELDPAFVFQMLVMLFHAAEDSYPKFMKLQWA